MLSKFNNKKHRRLTALLLCVALMLGSVTSVSADISAADSETEVQNYAEEPTTEAVSYGAPEAQTEVQEGTPVAEETEAPAADTQQTEAHTEAATEAHTETAAETQAAETTAEQQVQKEASEETKVSEEVQLTQDMKNAEGKTICKVIADLPEGAFNADASEITMEVKAVSSEDEEAVVKLIKNALTENTSLGNFVMYHVSFKVNGEDAEPQKAVSVIFKDTELDVQDVKNATVFYYNPANSDAGNKDAELVPIIQRDELIKNLQKEEQEIPDNFDEIYDTSEITLTDKGAADEIQMDAWKDRIYGCYVTETTAGDTDADETAAEEPKTAINAIAAVAEDSANNGNVTLTEFYGKLTASYTGSMSASDYKYVWYRSVNGGNAEVQKPVQYQDVNTGADLGQDISTDGTELYIALNGGALGYKDNTSVSYYVKVFKATDVDSDGTPKSKANALATSQSVSVTSYYELQNGSFEKPEISGSNWSQIWNDSYKKNDGVWQTTGSDRKIEVINTDYAMDPYYRWYGKESAADGKQFVELNCQADGSLYQDVLTTPGETLNYQLAHRARGLEKSSKSEEDTMYVVIMPTQTAIEKNVTSKYIDSNYKNLSGQGVLDLIKEKVNAANKAAWNLTDASTLTSKFQEIAGETLTSACSNVVITDRLSEYVDVTDNSKLRVKVAERNTAGNYSDKYSHDFALDVTGNDAKVIVNDETIATVSYDAENKTATLDFTDSYKLKADYYYYLTITNVIPNETAFSEYAKNKYSYGTTVGDASTDEGTGGYFATGDAKHATTGEITSSVQAGFFSNAKATVSYKNKESGSTITEEYAKPVVQVQIIPVKKVWSGAEPDDGTKILVQLVDQDGSPVDGKILELSKDNKWQNKLVVEKASKYDNYSYRELVADEKGSITYQNQKYSMASAGSDIVINHTSYKVTYSYEDDTRVITNTKNDQSMKIVKQNNSGINLEGATFTLKDAQNQSTEYTSDANGIVFNNNINYGTYTLKEIKAPNGY